ncbi:MAG: hypothetical protein R2845_14090, partial [Thermomicrobiales bacterium]
QYGRLEQLAFHHDRSLILLMLDDDPREEIDLVRYVIDQQPEHQIAELVDLAVHFRCRRRHLEAMGHKSL